MTSIGVVGVGLLGSAVTDRLLAGGYRVVGTSRTEGSRHRLGTLGAEVRFNPADVAREADLIIICVPDGIASRSVCLGSGGIAEGAPDGCVILDLTTCGPDESTTTRLALAERAVSYLDVGISGSSNVVAEGRALALVGGSLDHLTLARAALASFCNDIVTLPGPGDGLRTKFVVNLVHGLNRLALAEGLVLAERVGLDLPSTLDVLRRSAAASRALDAWGEQMAAGRHDQPASTIRIGSKDAALIAKLASLVAAPVPGWELFAELLKEAIDGGLADHDNSAIIEVLRRRAASGRVTDPPASRSRRLAAREGKRGVDQ